MPATKPALKHARATPPKSAFRLSPGPLHPALQPANDPLVCIELLPPNAPQIAESASGSTPAPGPFAFHDLATSGLSVKRAKQLLAAFEHIGLKDLLSVLGLSERTLQRADVKDKGLDTNASDRALRLMAVVAQATDVLGSRAAAERWLIAPAMGLDQRRPLDLLKTSDGTEMVKTLITRMDYGVYT